MQNGLHALGWALSRLGIAVVLAVFVALLAYTALVFVIVAGEGIAAFGQ